MLSFSGFDGEKLGRMLVTDDIKKMIEVTGPEEVNRPGKKEVENGIFL
jgi:hypothetical protein